MVHKSNVMKLSIKGEKVHAIIEMNSICHNFITRMKTSSYNFPMKYDTIMVNTRFILDLHCKNITSD